MNYKHICINYKKSISYLSLNRIFLNSCNIKHTNNTITLLLFLFNKNKIVIKKKLKKVNEIIKMKTNKRENINSNILMKRINNDTYYNYNIHLLKTTFKYIMNIKNNKYLLKKNYLASLYLNNYKFNYLNLINIKNIINKINNKKIKINLINIKNIHMDNNMFIDSITRKLDNRKKRILKVFKKGLNLAKVGQLKIIYNKNIIKAINKNNILNDINPKNYINFMHNYFYNKYEIIMRNMKNVHIVGMSLEGKGRLTKRMTASRSLYKIRTRGFIKNLYSSIYGISTLLIRGLNNSNISNIKNSSYNKNGSYGISITTNTF
jgi:hypothetical protein